MPPDAELPPEVVEGPRSRFEIPMRRVCTRAPEPAGAGVVARAVVCAGRAFKVAFALAFDFVDLRGASAFFLEPFALDFGAAFFFVDFPTAFFAELFLVEPFFAELFFLPEARAAMLDFPSRSW